MNEHEQNNSFVKLNERTWTKAAFVRLCSWTFGNVFVYVRLCSMIVGKWWYHTFWAYLMIVRWLQVYFGWINEDLKLANLVFWDTLYYVYQYYVKY